MDQLETNGYLILDGILPRWLTGELLTGLDAANKICHDIQVKNGITNSENTVHHLLGQHPVFMDLLEWMECLNPYFEKYFQGKYILNSYGGNLLQGKSSYANEIHRDIRTYSGDIPLMLNTIVMLDPFTEENGATWLMDRGHNYPNKPTQTQFDDDKFQITGSAGTVVLFNSNLWHQAGENTTYWPRRSLTPMWAKPFMKPQYDYTQFVNENSTEWQKQVLGYYSRVPTTLSNWYQPKEKRMYRSDQG